MKQMYLSLLLALFSLVLSISPVAGEESLLWGKNGEKWNEQSRLPDFSFAGYRFGEAELPSKPVEVSVKDFGAVGDGKTDDTEAFRRAVTEGAGKVISVPVGKYLISDQVMIEGHGTVLRGESRDESILFFKKGLEEMYPKPTKNDGDQPTTEWSWGGAFFQVNGKQIHSGKPFQLKGTAKKRDKVVLLEDSGSLEAGELIVMYWWNNAEQALAREIYAHDPGDISGINPNNGRLQVNKVLKVDGGW